MRGIIGVVAVLGALAAAAASAHAGSSPTYQLNAAHTGATVEPGLDPPFARRWEVDLGQPASFPLIGDGRVFVVVRNESEYGTQLYALAASDGRVLWRRSVAGTYYWAGIAYGDGKVFVVSFASRFTGERRVEARLDRGAGLSGVELVRGDEAACALAAAAASAPSTATTPMIPLTAHLVPDASAF